MADSNTAHTKRRLSKMPLLSETLAGTPATGSRTIEEEDGKQDGDTVANVFRLERRRWGILLGFSFLSMSNAFQWISYAPIVRSAEAYFHVGANGINFLSLLYMIIYVPTVLGSVTAVDKLGLRCALLASAVANLVAAGIKYVALFFTTHYVPLVVAQIFAAGSQVVFLGLPPLVGAVWFGAAERSTAVAVAVLSNSIGIALGFLLPPQFVTTVPNHNSTASELPALDLHSLHSLQHHGNAFAGDGIDLVTARDHDSVFLSAAAAANETSAGTHVIGFNHLFLFQVIIAAVALCILIIFARDRPHLPPSATGGASSPLSPAPSSSYPKDPGLCPRDGGAGEAPCEASVQWHDAPLAEHEEGEPTERSRLADPELLPHTDVLLPSSAGQHVVTQAFKAFSQLPNFLLFVSFSLCIGEYWAFATVLAQVLGPYGYSDKATGWLGFFNTVAGILSSVASGPFLDRYRSYRGPLLVILLASFTFLCAMMVPLKLSCSGHECDVDFSPPRGVYFAVYAAYIALGLFQTAVFPIALEYGVEITYPLSEAASGGALMGGANAVGIAMVLGFTAILGDNPRPAQSFWVFVVSLSCLLVSFITLLGIRTHLRRVAIDVTFDD